MNQSGCYFVTIHLNVIALICRKQWRTNTLWIVQFGRYLECWMKPMVYNNYYLLSYIDYSFSSSYTCSLKNSYYFSSIRNVCFCFVLFLPPCFTFIIRKKGLFLLLSYTHLFLSNSAKSLNMCVCCKYGHFINRL